MVKNSKKEGKLLREVKKAVRAPRRKQKKTTRKQRAAKGNSFSKSNAPVSVASILRNTLKDRVYKFPGNDFMASVSINPASVADGDVLYSSPIAPQIFKDTRTSNLAKAFAKYRFTKFVAIVGGNLSTNIGGGYIAGISPDPAIEIDGGPSSKNEVMGWPGAVRSAYYNPQVAQLEIGSTNKWLSTSQSAKTESAQSLSVAQGVIVVVADGAISGITGAFSLPVSISYEIEFDEPVSRPNTTSGSVFDFSVEYNQNGAPFNINNFGSSSGMAPNTNYTASANSFIQTILNNMQKNTDYIYMCDTPCPNGAYSGVPSGGVLMYCWKTTNEKVFWALTPQVAYESGETFSGSAGYFSWPTPLTNTLHTYNFTAMPNPLAVSKIPTVRFESHDIEMPSTTTTSVTTIFAEGDAYLTTSDTDYLASLLDQMRDVSEGAYSIVTNPMPALSFGDDIACNIIYKDTVGPNTRAHFSNDMDDVFSGSPTPSDGSGTIHDWLGHGGTLYFKYIEKPLSDGLVFSQRRGHTLDNNVLNNCVYPNAQTGHGNDSLHAQVQQLAASNAELSKALVALRLELAELAREV